MAEWGTRTLFSIAATHVFKKITIRKELKDFKDYLSLSLILNYQVNKCVQHLIDSYELKIIIRINEKNNYLISFSYILFL